MPARRVSLVNGENYHVFNRGITDQLTFEKEVDYYRFIDSALYYRNQSPSLCYSEYIRKSRERKREIVIELEQETDKLVKIIAYCLMPNHFHFVLEQCMDGGISRFMAKLCDSFTRYFNKKNDRVGPVLSGRFKAVLVESEPQFVHLVRYIHLNPYSSGLVKDLSDLEQYPYSSFPEYLGSDTKSICDKEMVLKLFKDKRSFRDFTFDYADHQRGFELIKRLAIDN